MGDGIQWGPGPWTVDLWWKYRDPASLLNFIGYDSDESNEWDGPNKEGSI